MEKNFYSAVVLPKYSGNPEFLTMHHVWKEKPWRFAGGKIEKGEVPIAAAARELYEELGIAARTLVYLAEIAAEADGGTWTGFYFLCPSYDGEPKIMEGDKYDKLAYVTADQLKALGSEAEYKAAKLVS